MTPRSSKDAAAGRGGSTTWPVKSTTSYGGIVVRTGGDGAEVALIKPRSDDGKEVWALPKGAKEPDESPEQAALREVREETGLDAEIVEAMEPITYWFAWAPEQVRYRKTVRYFLMRHTGGDPVSDGVEVADVRFVPLARAAEQASYASERKVLKAAADLARQW